MCHAPRRRCAARRCPLAEDDYESYAWPPAPPPPPPGSDEDIDCSADGLLVVFEHLKRGKAADAWGWRNEFIQLLVENAPSAATALATWLATAPFESNSPVVRYFREGMLLPLQKKTGDPTPHPFDLWASCRSFDASLKQIHVPSMPLYPNHTPPTLNSCICGTVGPIRNRGRKPHAVRLHAARVWAGG